MTKLHMLKSVTDTINTSLIFEGDSFLIAVDGGFPSEAEYLHDYIKSLGKDVKAWFVTHLHDDHVGALINIINNYGDIKPEKIYCNLPSEDFLVRNEPRQTTMSSAELLSLFKSTASNAGIPLVTVCKGDLFDFGGIKISVLLTPDHSIEKSTINNTSCVFSVMAGEKKVLILGDLGPEGGERLLCACDGDELKSDYVQMSHHGQDGVSKNVYAAIMPKYCLWCTPSWLWDNMGKGGYDTGIFKTVIVRGWMSEIGGIKRHYKMQEGDHIIEL